jgi:hypothetical protein
MRPAEGAEGGGTHDRLRLMREDRAGETEDPPQSMTMPRHSVTERLNVGNRPNPAIGTAEMPTL